jgi:hypothetical protein
MSICGSLIRLKVSQRQLSEINDYDVRQRSYSDRQCGSEIHR